MVTVKLFEDLDVWLRAIQLTHLIYDLSDSGSFGRDYVLRDQMRRATVPIMSNIAQEFMRRTQILFIEYLCRAKVSSGELRPQLNIARDCNHIHQEDFDRTFDLTTTFSKQLARFIGYLVSQPNVHRIKDNEVAYDV